MPAFADAEKCNSPSKVALAENCRSSFILAALCFCILNCSLLAGPRPVAMSSWQWRGMAGDRTHSEECDCVDWRSTLRCAATAKTKAGTRHRSPAHVRDDLLNPFEAGRQMAAGIPGASFVTLHGKNHFFLPGEPAAIRFWEELQLFLSK
jgi:hypothetical protein